MSATIGTPLDGVGWPSLATESSLASVLTGSILTVSILTASTCSVGGSSTTSTAAVAAAADVTFAAAAVLRCFEDCEGLEGLGCFGSAAIAAVTAAGAVTSPGWSPSPLSPSAWLPFDASAAAASAASRGSATAVALMPGSGVTRRARRGGGASVADVGGLSGPSPGTRCSVRDGSSPAVSVAGLCSLGRLCSLGPFTV